MTKVDLRISEAADACIFYQNIRGLLINVDLFLNVVSSAHSLIHLSEAWIFN